MKKYRVTIDDRTYEVVVEDVPSGAVDQTVVQPQPQETKVVEGSTVPAPLSGTILSVKYKVGDQVQKGKVLLTLEALKLENEIVAPVDGKLLEIVSVGETVETGQTLAVIS